MINILVIEEPILNGVTWWRFFRPFEVMRRLYPGRFNITFKRQLTTSDLFFNDVFILSRPTDADLLKFVQRAKEHGKIVILDLDDDILNLPDFHPLKADYTARRQIILQFFDLSDRVWVSTEQLLYVTDALGRGDVIPNAILPSDLPDEPAPDNGLWCWRGKDIQIHDLMTVGAAQYEQIKTMADRWVFWGYLPPLNHGPNAVLQAYEKDLESYFRMLKKSRINGVWKPLFPCLFNDAKSNIAWLEATMSGGICLTNYAGKPGWECALSEFPDYDTACQAWQLGRDHALAHYNLENTARQRAESIFNLVGSYKIKETTSKAESHAG